MNNNAFNQDINLNNFQHPQKNNIDDQKRHRRSKHELEGRIFICEHCNKSYLSKPALNNHLNSKHSDILKQMNIQKRPRGRPRKYLLDSQENINFPKNKYNTFFNMNKRAKIPSLEIDYHKVAQTVIDDLYVKYETLMNKPISNIMDHPILNHLLKGGQEKIVDPKTCDEIFSTYLDEILMEANETYLIFVVKFIILFREFSNINERNKSMNNTSQIEHTPVDNAEQLPEQCNEFFSSYLETNDFFGLDEDERNELIEIIQHFCFWLFSNNFTKSKLSLAG